MIRIVVSVVESISAPASAAARCIVSNPSHFTLTSTQTHCAGRLGLVVLHSSMWEVSHD